MPADPVVIPVVRRDIDGVNGCGTPCAGLCTEQGISAVLKADRALLHWRAMRGLGDSGLAEQAVQETLLRAWRACARFDANKGSVRTWLLAIQRNVLIDMGRARAARPVDTEWSEHGDLLDVRHASPDFADGLIDGLVVDALLARLPRVQREAVVEVILRDRAYREVAADLGVPVGTVKTRVYYALQTLRRLPLAA